MRAAPNASNAGRVRAPNSSTFGVNALAFGPSSVRTVSGIASSDGARALASSVSAARCRAAPMGRVACCASPRTALAYSMPPNARDSALIAKRCMK